MHKWKTMEKNIPIGRAISEIFTKTTQIKQSPNRRKFAQSGHPGDTRHVLQHEMGKQLPPYYTLAGFDLATLKIQPPLVA
jgi:hypothetical protein